MTNKKAPTESPEPMNVLTLQRERKLGQGPLPPSQARKFFLPFGAPQGHPQLTSKRHSSEAGNLATNPLATAFWIRQRFRDKSGGTRAYSLVLCRFWRLPQNVLLLPYSFYGKNKRRPMIWASRGTVVPLDTELIERGFGGFTRFFAPEK